MLHRALFGSLERFIGILIEHYAGKYHYGWLLCRLLFFQLHQNLIIMQKIYLNNALKAGINTEVDLKNQKINYKIREHSLSKVPLLLICGQKEVNDKSVTIRKLGSEKQETLSLDQAIKQISQKNKFPIN